MIKLTSTDRLAVHSKHAKGAGSALWQENNGKWLRTKRVADGDLLLVDRTRFRIVTVNRLFLNSQFLLVPVRAVYQIKEGKYKNQPGLCKDLWIKNFNIRYLHCCDPRYDHYIDTMGTNLFVAFDFEVPSAKRHELNELLLLLTQAWNDWKRALQDEASATASKNMVRNDFEVQKLKEYKGDNPETKVYISNVRDHKRCAKMLEKEAKKKLDVLHKAALKAAKKAKNGPGVNEIARKDVIKQIEELPVVAEAALKIGSYEDIRSQVESHLTNVSKDKKFGLLWNGHVSSLSLTISLCFSIGVGLKFTVTFKTTSKVWVANDRKFRVSSKHEVTFNLGFSVGKLELLGVDANVSKTSVDVYPCCKAWILTVADRTARRRAKVSALLDKAPQGVSIAKEFGWARTDEDISNGLQPPSHVRVLSVGGGGKITIPVWGGGKITIPGAAGFQGNQTQSKLKATTLEKNGELIGEQETVTNSIAFFGGRAGQTRTTTSNHLNPLNNGTETRVSIVGGLKGSVFPMDNNRKNELHLLMFQLAGDNTGGGWKDTLEKLVKSISGNGKGSPKDPVGGAKIVPELEWHCMRPEGTEKSVLQCIRTSGIVSGSVSIGASIGFLGVRLSVKALGRAAIKECIYEDGVHYLMRTYCGLKAWPDDAWGKYKKNHQAEIVKVLEKLKKEGVGGMQSHKDKGKKEAFLSSLRMAVLNEKSMPGTLIRSMEHMFDETLENMKRSQEWTPQSGTSDRNGVVDQFMDDEPGIDLTKPIDEGARANPTTSFAMVARKLQSAIDEGARANPTTSSAMVARKLQSAIDEGARAKFPIAFSSSRPARVYNSSESGNRWWE